MSADSDPKNLIVNYIPTPVSDEELRRLFEPFGTIESARVILDRVTHHPKGYGFVKFTTEEAAKKAIASMNGFEIGNKRLRVTQANGPQNKSIQKYSERVVQMQPQIQFAAPQAYTMVGPGQATMYATTGMPTMYLAPQYYVAQQQQAQAPQQPIIIEVDHQPVQLMTQGGALPPAFAQYMTPQMAGVGGGDGKPVQPLCFVPFKAGNPEADPIMHSSFQLSAGQGSAFNSAASFDPNAVGSGSGGAIHRMQ